MTVRTKADMAIDLSTGGSAGDTVESRLIRDILDSVSLASDLTGGTAVIKLPTYTVATLPAQNTAQIIYVSDGTANKRLAVSDGTNWRFPDGNVVT